MKISSVRVHACVREHAEACMCAFACTRCACLYVHLRLYACTCGFVQFGLNIETIPIYWGKLILLIKKM